MVARMDMATHEMKFVTMPKGRSQPYGMVFDSKGTVFFEEFGGPRLASIDPETFALKEYELPNPDTRPRRLAITSDVSFGTPIIPAAFSVRMTPRRARRRNGPRRAGRKHSPTPSPRSTTSSGT
jgi:virginiamycin B lyase